MTTAKICSHCRGELPLDRFSRNRSRPDGLHHICKQCDRERKARYLQQRRDKINAQNAASRTRRGEAARARERKWYSENRERVLAQIAARRLANPQTFRTRERAWEEANLEKRRQIERAWRERNRDKHAMRQQLRRAKTRTTALERFTREEIYLRDGGRCRYCNQRVGDTWHLAHLIALAKGGTHTRANVAVSCVTCNLRDHTGRSPVQLHMEA